MTNSIATAAVCSLCMLTFPMAIFAQQQVATVGELIEKGGKKLGREELTKLLSGSDVSGISTANPANKFELTFKRDGTVQGRGINIHGVGRSIQLWGRWSVSEQGELCVEGQAGGQSQSCAPYFELGGTYFQAAKDEKSEPVYHREIKR